MAHVPTQAEVDAMIDAMSEEQLDAYLAGESGLTDGVAGATPPESSTDGTELIPPPPVLRAPMPHCS
ncbi:hypothetical protein [Actinomyces ruminis]|uniref:hypothetical protein n=1 Tax=Actinomyces ruminis TaxID=1937003 RepID=UPI003B849976